jgi:hypothetical protein
MIGCLERMSLLYHQQGRPLPNVSYSRPKRGRSDVVGLVRDEVCVTAVRHLAQQRVHPTPPLRHFGPEKVLLVQPALPRTWVDLRRRG